MGSAVPGASGIMDAWAIGEEAAAEKRQIANEQYMHSQNAKNIKQTLEFNLAKQQMEANQTFGSMRAAQGASGIESGSGSPLEVLRQSYANAELDRLSIIHDAKIRKTNELNQIRFLDDQRRRITDSAKIQTASALIGGAGKSFKSYGGSSAQN